MVARRTTGAALEGVAFIPQMMRLGGETLELLLLEKGEGRERVIKCC
jgi:hypothetical protein